MAALPSPTQVAGNHSAIYEALYNYVDPKGIGTVGAMEAARFLKKSGLSDVVLSRVWDLSDPGGRGCLDKTGMFVALKLVAVAQSGKDINISNITMDLAPPKMGDIQLPKPAKPPQPSVPPLISSLPPSAVDWAIKPLEREKYDKLFDSLQPLNGMIPGNKVKGVLMDSKLPVDTLGKIWELADQNKDGMLDRHEFVVAMHLVYKALEKHAIPNTLPPELMPPAKRKGSTPLSAPLMSRGIDGVKPDLPPPPVLQSINSIQTIPPSQTMPHVPKPVQPVQPTLSWVVTTEEKSKSDALFIKSDIDRDGFVSGQEIKDVFIRSGVPQPILAHIWALCDIKQSGKLNNEQFALAMWFVARCLKGADPPSTLTPEMIPPSFRSTKPAEGLVENNNTCYSNPELDMVSKDIDELAREKLALETDITQKEADIKIKSGEVKSLQSELDTLAATLKQLENQKGEAQKRLNDLKAQRTTVDNDIEEVNNELEPLKDKVDKLRSQASEQAETVAVQESELNSKKQQLEGLKQEEQSLEQQKGDNSRKLEQLTTKLQDTQFNISQAKRMITQLEEQTRQMKDAITACDTAIDSGDPTTVPDVALRINPEFRDPSIQKLSMVNGDSSIIENGFDNTKDDPFSNRNGITAAAGFNDDPFKSDPFKNEADAFGSNDPFSSTFPQKSHDGFSSDPFSSFGNSTNVGKTDPFDAFGDTKAPSVTPAEPEKDPFGCDPFAVLHAPTRDGPPPGRPSSPSPALPPKKSKQPPPRPAPPRPQPPSINKPQSDPFSSDPFGSSGGFANFADFDSKFSDKSTANTSTATTKSLEFTDDPFKDYRYEDPFNIKFDFEERDEFGKSNENINNKNSDKFDPFGLDGRQSVPLPTADPFKSVSGRASVPLPTSKSDRLPSEDQQLAWAARESLKLEEARKQKEIQEQADLELAIALSKADNK